MVASGAGSSEVFPPASVHLEQIERYRFKVTYSGTSLPAQIVDEGAPLGGGTGPDPVLALAAAVGHCMSSTFHNTLERARVRATPIRTMVTVTLGRNARGRKRVLSMDLQIECAPLDESDRPRFERGVEVFEDYCTVTGSVREGARVGFKVKPPMSAPVPGPAA